LYSWVQLSHIALWSGGGFSPPTAVDFPVITISTDTRELRGGEVFAALRGDNFDGHNFIAEAIRLGAKAIIAEKPVIASVPVIIVADTLTALVNIGSQLRKHFAGPVFAITGSAGKSSTKEMLSCLLGPQTVTAPASYNNLLGVSKTLGLINSQTSALVLEIGMNAEGEIKEICSHFTPTAGLITNIGDAHIGKLGGKEGIFRAKKELFDFLATRSDAASTHIAVNTGDPLVERAYRETFKDKKVPTITYSANPSVAADVRILEKQLDPQRGFLHVRLQAFDEVVTFRGAIFGLHHAQNLVAAVAAALSLGKTLTEISNRFAMIRPARHRGEVIELSEGRVLIDESYNSNPSALHSAIESLAALDSTRHKLVVVGDMLEMGSFSTDVHQEMGKSLASLLTGQPYTLVAVGKEVKALVQGLMSAQPSAKCLTFASAKDALSSVRSLFVAQSFCLIKGSRGVQLDRLVEGLIQ